MKYWDSCIFKNVSPRYIPGFSIRDDKLIPSWRHNVCIICQRDDKSGASLHGRRPDFGEDDFGAHALCISKAFASDALLGALYSTTRWSDPIVNWPEENARIKEGRALPRAAKKISERGTGWVTRARRNWAVPRRSVSPPWKLLYWIRGSHLNISMHLLAPPIFRLRGVVLKSARHGDERERKRGRSTSQVEQRSDDWEGGFARIIREIIESVAPTR